MALNYFFSFKRQTVILAENKKNQYITDLPRGLGLNFFSLVL